MKNNGIDELQNILEKFQEMDSDEYKKLYNLLPDDNSSDIYNVIVDEIQSLISYTIEHHGVSLNYSSLENIKVKIDIEDTSNNYNLDPTLKAA